MTPEEYKQLKAFVSQDGIYLGALWVLSFACLIGEFKFQILGTIGIVLAIISPILVVKRLKRYRDWGLGGNISFRRALFYCLMLFLYASLLFALVQYIYFQFIDNGYLLQQYNLIMSSPNMQEMIKVYNIKEQMEEGLSTMASMTSIEKVANIMSVNIFTGIMLSIPIAIMMRRSNVRNNISTQ